MNQKNNNAKMLNSKIKKAKKKNRVKDPCKVDENQHPWV